MKAWSALRRERREPILVPDVEADDRYLSASDVVRSELSVPMIARHRLVGVIDVQSTRTGAFKDYDRAMLRLIARARRGRHRQRAAIPARRAAVPDHSNALARFPTNSRRFSISTNC